MQPKNIVSVVAAMAIGANSLPQEIPVAAPPAIRAASVDNAAAASKRADSAADIVKGEAERGMLLCV